MFRTCAAVLALSVLGCTETFQPRSGPQAKTFMQQDPPLQAYRSQTSWVEELGPDTNAYHEVVDKESVELFKCAVAAMPNSAEAASVQFQSIDPQLRLMGPVMAYVLHREGKTEAETIKTYTVGRQSNSQPPTEFGQIRPGDNEHRIYHFDSPGSILVQVSVPGDTQSIAVNHYRAVTRTSATAPWVIQQQQSINSADANVVLLQDLKAEGVAAGKL